MRTILLVDDEDFFRDRMAMAFQRRGYTVYDAPSYDDAMDLIRCREIDICVRSEDAWEKRAHSGPRRPQPGLGMDEPATWTPWALPGSP